MLWVPEANCVRHDEFCRTHRSRVISRASRTLTPNEVPNMDLIRILLAILLPPLGVFLQVGIGPQFWINILLTLLGYIPGIIHAVWIILKR